MLTEPGAKCARESTAWRYAPRCARRLENRSIHGLEPVVDVLSHLVLRDAVALLDLAFELLTFSVHLGEIVVRELTPFLLDLAFGLLPVSFDAVPIHSSSPP